jgi:MSHA biogenesis protein MshQ
MKSRSITVRLQVMARLCVFTFFGMMATLAGAQDAFFETGSVVANNSIDRGGWVSVSLRETYDSPVVIVGPVTHNNDNSLSARVRNVTASGFEVGFQSPCESAGRSAGGVNCPPGGNWNSETIRYWVVEEGAWEFPDGTLIEAGYVNTSTVRSGVGNSNAADTVTFQQTFSSDPAIFHSVASFNDPDWIASTVFGSGTNTAAIPGTNDFSLALEGAEVTSSHGAENVAWVAVEQGVGSNNGNRYAIDRTPGLDVDRHRDACEGIGFSGFSATPDAVASHNTMNGTNGGWVRFCGGEVRPSGVAVHIDEDQVNDAERTGIPEAVSVFAFTASGTGQLTRPDTFCTSIDALFCDDFDVGTLASDGWTIDSFRGGNAGINSDTSSSGTQSLFTSDGGVNVISPVFDLSESTSGSLAYWWRRGDDDFSENPDGNENFRVQYLDDGGQWQDIEVQRGNGTPGEIGTTDFDLPVDAFHAGFQFRFRQDRGDDGFDFWHVDDVVLREQSFICEPDDFNRSDLGPDWVTSRSSGNFSPQIVNGRLRMTEASNNQATAATYQRTFPGADNFIQVEFDYYAYGGSGADGLAVVFSDAAITPQAGGFGGSLGYAQEPDGTDGFAGGWLGIGLDEYGNFSNDNEGRVGGNNGRTLDSVAVRGAEPDYPYIADSGGLSPGIDANNDNNPYRYRITIDSRNNQTPTLTVERNGRGTGNSFELVIQETLSSQPAIPENLFLSLTGSTGGATNFHELDNLQICADKVGPVQRQIDHFEIEHSGTSLTCRSETVTIRACDNADCSQTFNDPVDVTLAPSSGWEGGNTFTMTGGTATRTLRVTTPSTVTLGVPSSSPQTKAFAQTLCSDGSAGGVSASKCDLTFFDSGFDITVPDHVSGMVQTATIAAVRKDDDTEECVPGFDNETKSVSLWSGYTNPSSGTLPVEIDGSPIPGSAGPTRSLNFDGNGEATVQLQYADVGRVALNARFEGSGEETGLLMLGNSAFVARPDRFRLTIPGNPAAAGVANGNDFVAAGEAFEIEVASLNASGDITPNFNRESPNEDVALTHALVAPAGGALPPLNGSFGDFGEDCSGGTAADGTACGLFSWEEVGILELSPELTSGQYLGTENVSGEVVDRVGRFIPDRFNVSADEGSFPALCPLPDSAPDPFTYTGQVFGWGVIPMLEIEPVSVNNNRTRNYANSAFSDPADQAFQRLSLGDVVRGPVPTSDASALDVNNDPLSIDVAQGVGSLSIVEPGLLAYQYDPGDTVSYTKTVNARVAPVTNPSIEFIVNSIVDADAVAWSGAPFTLSPTMDFEIRYGRLDMDNVYGPENLPGSLPMPFQVEYWNGSRFVLNAQDNCTAWNTVNITDTELYHSLQPDNGVFVDGEGGPLQLTPNGTTNDEPTDTLTWSVPVWLQSDFDDDGTLENPSALATFGVYRGNDRVIYWQER